MEDYTYLISLYDIYGELFNEIQKECFERYYFDNLSLSEIADNMDKSRNAIHSMIKSVVNKLYEYEKILKIYDNNIKIRKIIEDIENKDIRKRIEELL